MKILIIFPHFNSLALESGAQTRSYNLIRQLLKKNVEVVILHPLQFKGQEKIHHPKLKVFYYQDYEIFGLPLWYLADFNPSYIRALFTIRTIEKDIDLVQIEFPWGSIAARLILNKPLIYDAQGVETVFAREVTVKMPKVPRILKPFLPIYIQYQEMLTCSLSQQILTVSGIDKNNFLRLFRLSPQKFHTIHTGGYSDNALDRSDKTLIENLKKKFHLPLDKILVIFHGHLPHHPNQEAFDLIHEYIAPNIHNSEMLFVLAGKIPKYEKGRVISLGFVDDLKDFLMIGDIAIVPILSGSGMRIKIMDYVLANLPIVTTKKGLEGLNLIPDTHLVVVDGVNKEFIAKINELAQNGKKRNELSNNLKQLYVEKFSWDFLGKQFLGFYNRVLKFPQDDVHSQNCETNP